MVDEATRPGRSRRSAARAPVLISPLVYRRRLTRRRTAGHVRATGGELGLVQNDDYVSSQLRMASGARVVLEASRIAAGEQNNYGFGNHGTKGAVFWDFRRLGELGVSVGPPIRTSP